MDFDANSPIWLQLTAEFTRRIVTGTWAAGDKIPAVRELAVDLRVNPNTVQRALSELERVGLTHTERTTGRFVTTDPSAIAVARGELAAGAAATFVARARGLGMDLPAATDLLAHQWSADPTQGGVK